MGWGQRRGDSDWRKGRGLFRQLGYRTRRDTHLMRDQQPQLQQPMETRPDADVDLLITGPDGWLATRDLARLLLH